MKIAIIIAAIAAWWAVSVGGYFLFKKGAKDGLYVPETRYNGDTERWYKEARIAALCGGGLPLYFTYFIAKRWKK